MVASYLLLTLFFLGLMLAGLVLAQQIGQVQSRQISRLSRLSGLEARRKQVYETARALQQMETDADVLTPLYNSLLDDLRDIRALDPARSDLDKQMQEAEAGSKKAASGGSSGGSAAVATEEELTMTQRHIQRAMSIFVNLYKADKISAGQYQSCREKLRLLGIRVAVNSCLLMAQKAVENEDSIRAMSCYRRAESFLSMKGLSNSERAEKHAYISGERQKLLEYSAAGRGLLMFAAD